MERAGVFKGKYHVLQGKLSPTRLAKEEIKEIISALGNDIEGEATCHFLKEEIIGEKPITTTRIGFGLPSGAGITYADETTLRSALEGRKMVEED